MNIVENKVALQPYRITMSKHQLTAIELRLLNLCFFHLKEEQVQGFCNDVMNKKGLFDTHKIIKIKNADITVNSNYEHVRKALYKLTKRDIELDSVIDGKPSTLITNLIHYADYSKDKTTIEIEINKRLVPEFLKLGKNYTKYGIDFGFKTQCRYAIRWYQLACHWQKKGSFRVNIDDIKKLFKISSHMYSRLESFRRRVITNPFKELKEKSDVWLEILDIHKQGKRIVGYTFSVHKKNVKKIENSRVIEGSEDSVEPKKNTIRNTDVLEFKKSDPVLVLHAYMSKYERDLDIWRDVFSHYKLDLRSFLGTFKANSTEYKNYDHFKNSIRKYLITCIQHRDKGVSKQEVLDFYQKYSL